MIKFSGQLILASQSPRRQEILERLGFPFQVVVKSIDEWFPAEMEPIQVPAFLARQKAEAFGDIAPNEVVLTADTVVIDPEGLILNKPADAEEAASMLRRLSGKTHEVLTAFCIRSAQGMEVQTDRAYVSFRDLTEAEIQYYITTCQPFDKAGSYGVQDFIGLAGIVFIEGSYFTVMGLPAHRVYTALKPWIVW